MYPKIYSGGQEVAVLTNASNDVLTEKLNAERVYSFSAYQKDLVSEYLVYNNQILADGQFYDIKYVQSSQNGAKIEKKVQAEHVSYRLINDVYDNYAFTGTPTQIVNDLLTGTDFSAGTIDFTDSLIFVVNEKATALNIILRLVSVLGGKLDYSGNGFLVDIKNEIGANEGFEITIKKNMKSVDEIVDGRGDLKTYYKASYVNMDESEGYTLKGLESANLGDTVRIKNDNIGIDTSNVVLKITRSIIKSKVNTVELANTLEDFTNTFNTFTQTSVNKGSKVYGVQLDNDNGLVIERYDQLARSTFNADTWKAEKGDGLGGYEDRISFDPVLGEYVFRGKIIVEAIDGLDADDVSESATRIWADTTWRATGKTTIDGGAIETDTVTALQINVVKLSAISADLGTITAGDVNAVKLDILDDISVGNRIILQGPGSTDKNIDFAGGVYEWNGQEWEPITIPTAYINYSTTTNDLTMYNLGDVIIRSSAGDIDLRPFQNLNYNGSEIATRSWVQSQGYGDITSVSTGTGLNGGAVSGAVNLSLDLTYTDDRYCQNESSIEIGLQVLVDNLEVFQNGTVTHTIPMIPV